MLSRHNTVRNLLLAVMGTVIQFYSSSLYMWLLPVFSQMLFTGSDDLSALSKTWVLNTLSHVCKPAAAVFFGFVGDRYGRRSALFYSSMTMSAACLLMASLPSHAAWVVFAVLLCKSLQQIALAGETPGSAIFIVEHVGANRRGLGSGIMHNFVCVGLIAALLVSWTLCSYNISWRWAYVIGALLVIPGAAIRYWGSESAEYLKSKQQAGQVQVVPISKMPIRAFCTFAFSGAMTAAYFFVFIFLSYYLQRLHAYSAEEGHALRLGLHLVYMAATLCAGYLWDHCGRKFVPGFSALLLLLGLPIGMGLIAMGDPLLSRIAIFGLALGVGFFNGPSHAMTATVCPTRARYRMVSIGYALGSVIIGSNTASACLAAAKSGLFLPTCLFMGIILLFLVALALAPFDDEENAEESHHTNLK